MLRLLYRKLAEKYATKNNSLSQWRGCECDWERVVSLAVQRAITNIGSELLPVEDDVFHCCIGYRTSGRNVFSQTNSAKDATTRNSDKPIAIELCTSVEGMSEFCINW